MLLFLLILEPPSTLLPTVNIPDKIDGNQAVTCVSPDARPTPVVELYVDGELIQSKSTTVPVVSTKTEKTIVTAIPQRAWNNRKLKCCYSGWHIDRMCSPELKINMSCMYSYRNHCFVSIITNKGINDILMHFRITLL